MIRRLVGLVLLVLAVLWWWKRLRASLRQGPSESAAARETPSEIEPMVRDRVCNTFLLRSRALTLRAGGEEHHFCSEACRAKFLETTEIRSA